VGTAVFLKLYITTGPTKSRVAYSASPPFRDKERKKNKSLTKCAGQEHRVDHRWPIQPVVSRKLERRPELS